LNDPFELPSIEEIEQMERQRSQAISSLQISGNSVKCQRCGIAVHIVGKLARPCNDRADIAKAYKAAGKLLLAMPMISMGKRGMF